MKHWIAAAAAAPMLLACATAGAQTADPGREDRVLIINGERIVIGKDGDAVAAIKEALEGADGSGRVVFEFEGSSTLDWAEEDRAAFARAMAAMADAFNEEFQNGFNFDFDFDMERSAGFEADERRVEVMVRRIERDAERRAERIEREAERMAYRAERMAERMARHAARTEAHGLRAGVAGVEAGLRSIEQVLERGWYHQWTDGDRERVELTDERRAELEDTRAELLASLEALRADLAEAEARRTGEGREVRIVRRNGEARGWVNGDEVTGSELDRLLEGAPDTPQSPDEPDE